MSTANASEVGRQAERERTGLGITLSLIGGVLMGGVGVAGKFGAHAGLSPFQMLAAQVTLLVPIAGVGLSIRHGRSGFIPVRPSILVVRTLSGSLYFLCFYWALQGISVANALVLESTNPFFAMAMGRVLLGQRTSRASIGLAALAFVGVCLILIDHDAKGLINPHSLLALLAGVGRAAGSVSTGVAGRTEPPERIMFYYAAGMLLLSLTVLPWQWFPVRGNEWWILVAPALVFVPQNLALTVATRLVPAYLVGALFYTAILVGVAADHLIWKTPRSDHEVLGMVLVVAAGLALALVRAHESRKARAVDTGTRTTLSGSTDRD